MSFTFNEGRRVEWKDIKAASSQIGLDFIELTAQMTKAEFDQCTEGLLIETMDFWYGRAMMEGFWDDKDMGPERRISCWFGFISDIDAMGFKLRWE